MTPPQIITNLAKQAGSASKVLEVMRAEHDNPQLNLISVSAAWTRLAELERCGSNDDIDESTLLMFFNLTQFLLETHKPTEEARQIANIFWAVARLQSRVLSQPTNLLKSVALAARMSAKEMKAQEVANVMWAIGQLTVHLGESAVLQELHEVLPTAASRAVEVLSQATPQEIANSCSGLALSNYYDGSFFEAVAKQVTREAAGWKRRSAQLDLPEVLCAFACLKVSNHDLLDAAAKKLATLLVSDMNDWGLCALTWSFRELERKNRFATFRQRLDREVAGRRLSAQDVERSRLGAALWHKNAKKRASRATSADCL